MASTKWYIQLRGQVIGPMSEAELRELAAHGGTMPQTPVSRDGVTWTTAVSVPGLQVGPPCTAQSKSAPKAPPTAGGWSGPAWLLGGIVVGGLVVLTCGGLFLLLVVLAASEPEESGPTASAPAVSAPSDPPPPTREQIIARRTYEYWCGLRQSLMSDLPSDTEPDAQTMAAFFHRAVAKIRVLPTSDVDQDAVQCGVDAATVLANLAGYIDHANDPARLVEAFLRGAAGDPFGSAAESLSTHSALGQQIQQLDTEFDNARAILSSRYGVEFPSI